MRTLADIKRRAQLGVKVDTFWHLARRDLNGGNPRTGRTITKVGATVIEIDGSYLAWPKAKEVRIDGPDTFTILDETTLEPAITYTFRDREV